MLYKKEYIENNKKLKEENKRLNDIINELEKYISIQFKGACQTEACVYLEISDKIKELKNI